MLRRGIHPDSLGTAAPQITGKSCKIPVDGGGAPDYIPRLYGDKCRFGETKTRWKTEYNQRES